MMLRLTPLGTAALRRVTFPPWPRRDSSRTEPSAGARQVTHFAANGAPRRAVLAVAVSCGDLVGRLGRAT